MFHKNSFLNPLPHHLYQIIDKIDGDVFKYGISCEPIGRDGMSDRMRKQGNLFNLIDDWERFFAVIILYDIQGKIEAKLIERIPGRSLAKTGYRKGSNFPHDKYS